MTRCRDTVRASRRGPWKPEEAHVARPWAAVSPEEPVSEVSVLSIVFTNRRRPRRGPRGHHLVIGSQSTACGPSNTPVRLQTVPPAPCDRSAWHFHVNSLPFSAPMPTWPRAQGKEPVGRSGSR